MTAAQSFVRAPIRLYRAVRLPRPPSCRYVPTCSEYALEAIEVHGAVKGLLLAAKRITRCAPWGGWGSDPVPERRHDATTAAITRKA